MHYIALVEIPARGDAARMIEVPQGYTVAQLIASENLGNVTITIDSRIVPASLYETTTLDNAREVFASLGVKGA